MKKGLKFSLKGLRLFVMTFIMGVIISSVSTIKVQAFASLPQVDTKAKAQVIKNVDNVPFDVQPWKYSSAVPNGMSIGDKADGVYYELKLEAIRSLLEQEPSMKSISSDVNYWADRLSLQTNPAVGRCDFIATYNEGAYYRTIVLNAQMKKSNLTLDTKPWIYNIACPTGMSVWDDLTTPMYQDKVNAIKRLLQQEPVMKSVSSDINYWADRISLRSDVITGNGTFVYTTKDGTCYYTAVLNNPIAIKVTE
jgi:hypothetical protein